MIRLQHRNILLVISGGIAAYKCLDLIRRLREAGARVRCVLTKSGAEFVTPLSLATLSEEPVFTDMFSLEEQQKIGHINLSREADLVVVAPATANLMAKMAQGLADDLASTVLLAANKPIMVAPAMNCVMWQHQATQTNVATLRERGVKIIGPAKGAMACGEVGEGRMVEISDILGAIQAHFAVLGSLSGRRALVTSGPTHEPLDPVRFIGNRSSGKQGQAVAAALAQEGAEVVLVTGPTALPDLPGMKTVHVNTAQEMLKACEAEEDLDVIVCAAAVADWRPVEVTNEKMKKGKAEPVLRLTENPDILATLSKKEDRARLVIGFAAETGDALKLAKEKFERKGCDWLLMNDVSGGKVFGEDDNEVTRIYRGADGLVITEKWPRQSKQAVAKRLVEEVVEALEEKDQQIVQEKKHA